MVRLSRIAALAPVAAIAFASPAAAQDEPGDKVNMVIAYSEDECPEAQDGEIVVCEILVEADRYRIPTNLRHSDSPENVSRARQIESIRYIGEFGTLSCSPVGSGGFTGCNQKLIDAAYAERTEGENVRFAQLVEEAREARLATIDADAADEQERVEEIERDYLERLERERDVELPGGSEESGAAKATDLAVPPPE